MKWPTRPDNRADTGEHRPHVAAAIAAHVDDPAGQAVTVGGRNGTLERVRECGRFGGASIEGTHSDVPHRVGQRRRACARRSTGSSHGDGGARHRPVTAAAIAEEFERRPDRRERLLHRLRGPGRCHDAGAEDVPIDLLAIEGMLLHDRDQLGQIRAARPATWSRSASFGVLVPPPPPHPAAADRSISARESRAPRERLAGMSRSVAFDADDGQVLSLRVVVARLPPLPLALRQETA